MSADLVELVVGLAMLGVGVAAMTRVRSKTRGWTFAKRARLVTVPGLLLVTFYVIAFASAGLGALWVVPTGFAGVALLELAALRVTERRLGPGRSVG